MTKIQTGIKVTAPAVVANLACGFEVLALALEGPADEIVVQKGTEAGVHLRDISGDHKKLSLELEKNSAGLAALAVWKFLVAEQGIDPNIGIDLSLKKKIPMGRGLGSSAASAVAGAMAINEFFGSPLTKRELLPFAVIGESICSNHTNVNAVAASLLGGCMLVRDAVQLDVQRIFLPRGLYVAIAYPPQMEVLHTEARALLSTEVPLAAAIKQAGNLAGLVLGFQNCNFELIRHAMQDNLIAPQAAARIPHFEELCAAALEGGALGTGIAGSGPAIFALCNSSIKAEICQNNMQGIFDKYKIKGNTFISPVNMEGAILS